MRAIGLLSGGLDSTVALALVRAQEPGGVVLALTVDYGQRAAAREVDAARRIAARLGVPHRVVALPFFRELGGGALLDATLELPRPDAATLDRGGRAVAESADRVWVPNRNGVFIEVAAAFAESLGADTVVVGFNREEAATFPDNSQEYLAAVNGALHFSTRGRVALASPTAALDKVEIVRAGAKCGAPLDLIWPCYEGGADPCGTCESCQRLRRAAARAGVRIGRPPF
jgi:7-cyano-7-deazaguanine synthase